MVATSDMKVHATTAGQTQANKEAAGAAIAKGQDVQASGFLAAGADSAAAKELSTVTQMLEAACVKDQEQRLTSSAKFGKAVATVGLPLAMQQLKLLDLFRAKFVAKGKKNSHVREGALLCLTSLCQQAPKGSTAYVAPLLQAVYELMGDKTKSTAKSAKACSKAIMTDYDDNLAGLFLAELLKSVDAPNGNVSRLKKITQMCAAAPTQMSTLLADALPAVIPFVRDLNAKVVANAKEALGAMCKTSMNPDIEPFIPKLMEAMCDPALIPETVHAVASTTFVAEVETSTLSIMAPVLQGGLAVRSKTVVKRQCARIIENMSKLVDEPRHLESFLPKILPLLESAKEKVSDPECRNVCSKAWTRLNEKWATVKPSFTREQALAMLKTEISVPEHLVSVLELAAAQCDMLNQWEAETVDDWNMSVATMLTTLGGVDQAVAERVVGLIRKTAIASRVQEEEEEIDDDAEVLCDLPFGLAYGNKVLLRKTKLKLLRGHKYGLLGQNDSGKTSLLKTLADYKIEGFPTPDQCRTIFVATDIDVALADLTVLEYMFQDALLKDSGVTHEKMEKTLVSTGFDGKAASVTQKVGTLSGGWRMKLALSRAMCLKADILMLDEPTNHLDAYNVKWVEAYLQSLTDVTCVMVSHDSGLLSRVCTDIIEINRMKLHYHRGNLDSFVAKKPEAKCYFELADEGKYDFTFPNPGPLPGVSSKGKAILRMQNITFTYPGVEKAQLNNVSVQVSLSSRVACVGENGAGKSTMIKLLTGELEPDEGSGKVWKHPNARVGYIAQHAFHHIEHHLDKTANEYIRWRFAGGGDREELVKVTSINTDEELKLMASTFPYTFTLDDGTLSKQNICIERMTEKRRDNRKKGTQEYEAVLKNDTKVYLDRNTLIKYGWEKGLKKIDERIAIRATTFARPLTKENVEKHLAAVGLEAEFATHMRIASLSGGQKVKVVLASALWMQPHILILDEPTNYLDRESLGAMARAIRKFEGGVVMITHNSQFCDNLCPVVWHLQNNTLDVKGDAEWMAEAGRQAIKVDVMDADDMVDRFGNTVTIKKRHYTKKEMKIKTRRRQKRFKETGDDYDSDSE